MGQLLRWGLRAAVSVPTLILATPALAEDAVPTLDSGDTAWMLTATLLVLMMTIPGVALFYGGMVRKKNVLSMAMQSFAITCVISVVWMVLGYSLSFGEGGWFYGDFSLAFLQHMTVDSLSGTFPETIFMTFQMTFAIITVALIAGAVAERMKFSALMIFSVAFSLLVYAPITHWVWGGGFLATAGVLDFAGGTVVHINSGVAGLVACLMLRQRVGFRRENMQPHNLVLSMIGASLLWVGWFGFNAGSAVAADGAAGMAMAVTQIAAAAGGVAWMLIEWGVAKKPSVLGIISGAVAGLVAITPAAGFVGPAGALVIGLAAGAVSFIACTWLKRRLGYDDSLDVFGIHG
ncbi:MAG: ammonium transporter, partial [Rhodospirillaceae bacterium]|nr:ammonium transporter [Rhodospirillaceae bacterium]